jgi:hypothetical protein
MYAVLPDLVKLRISDPVARSLGSIEMVVSVHIADPGARTGLKLFRRGRRAFDAPGLRYAEAAARVPLGGKGPPLARPGKLAVIASWDDDAAIDRFLSEHPLAERLADGWHVRMEPRRIVGAWPEMDGLPAEEERMDPDEAAIVLTLGRPRVSQLPRFVRTSRPAEALAVENPAFVAGTALIRPPISFVATFTIWSSVNKMRDYALGRPDPRHLDAIKADRTKTFHHQEAFVRFRPYAAHGTWDGREPLSEARSAGAAVSA